MYRGILKERGIVVESEIAFDYAMQRIQYGTAEVKKEFEEWFYSGNWVKEEDEI